MANCLISICITSYKRINELKRCLYSIDCSFYEDIEIIVSEDNSPLKDKIMEMVYQFKKSCKYNIVFNSNEENLGYDKNLAKLISLSNGEYIIFCSDDDVFIPHSIDHIYNFLKKNEVAAAFSPFINHDGRRMRSHLKTVKFEKGENTAKKILQDTILFSGLIYKRKLINKISANRFVNLNYFQVYLMLIIAFKYGVFYINIPLIQEGGDGENGFGTTELSAQNSFLANRKSVFSNLEFNKGLIKVVKIFDDENNTSIIEAYSKKLCIGTYREMAKAMSISNKMFEEYWHVLNLMPVKITFIAKLYYYMFKLLGVNITLCILHIPRILCINIRKI